MKSSTRQVPGLGMAMIAMVVMTCGMAISDDKGAAKSKQDQRQLRHVVMFKFKEGTSASQVKTIEDAFRGLTGKIDTIVDFEWGTDVSVEDLADGFTHCFLVTFHTQAGLNAYLPHEAHQGFVAVLKPHLDKVLVVDYWARK
ncbi:MAG: Dabb family protein [Pirellulaceae bacterium]